MMNSAFTPDAYQTQNIPSPTALVARRSLLKGAAGAAALGLMAPIAAAFAEEAGGDVPPDVPEGDMGPGGDAGDGGTPPDMPEGGGMGSADTMNFDYTGTYTATLTADGEEVSSDGEDLEATETDVNVALAQNGGTLTIANGTLSKAGDDTQGDPCNFYGVNSIVLSVGEGSAVHLDQCVLTATSEGSNGVFATDGAEAFVTGCSIATEAGNSRGLDATYGGRIEASDVDIQTQGDHCAAVATDRGGGEITVSGGTFSTAGSGSPLLYSTGFIQVSDVTGTATGSQIAGMEGLNTILIADSELTSTITDRTASDPVADGVILYQSTSGDAEASTGDTATFQALRSTLSSAIASGALFYCTNTQVNVVLSETELSFDSEAARLAYVAGNDANSWGQAGSNGAVVTFTGRDQVLAGDVAVDTISSLAMFLLDGSMWTGSASIEENAAGSTVDAPLTVNVDETSTWIVTADATISALNVAEGGQVVDADGNQATIVAAGQTVVTGPSAITVNVVGAYGTTVETTSANDLAADLASA